MDVEFIIESRVYVLFSILAILVLYKLMHNKYCQGINHIPGPFLASFTDFWRLFLVWGRRAERTHIHLHEKYGDCVRIGPKTILVADWDAVKQIYALNAGYVKVSHRHGVVKDVCFSALTETKVRILSCDTDYRKRETSACHVQHNR